MSKFELWRARFVAVALLAGAAGAHAQTPAPAQAPTQAYDVPQIDRLFGDWGGLQTDLQQRGINVQLDAVTEFAGNVSGGTKQGATFASQEGFQADVNWERLAGILGLSTHVIIVQRSGSSDSALFGDNLLPVQEVYGSGGDVGLHLVSAYAQETLMDGRFDIAAGRMNVENDFASSPLYCNFMKRLALYDRLRPAPGTAAAPRARQRRSWRSSPARSRECATGRLCREGARELWHAEYGR